MSNEFTDSEKIFRSLGGFWYTLFDEGNQIEDLLEAVTLAEQQILKDTESLERSYSRRDIDVYRDVQWFPLKIKESELLVNRPVYTAYDNQAVSYNESSGTQWLITSVPENLIDFEKAQDHIWSANTVWDNLEVESDGILLPDNPFDLGFHVDCLYDDKGKLTDREVTIWLYNSKWATKDLYEQYGYALDLNLPASDGYKQLINALMDSLVNGPSRGSFMLAASAITGIPVINNQVETVQDVLDNRVVTDKDIYIFSDNDTITVVPGDVLHLGDTMSEGMELCTDDLDSIPVVCMDEHFIQIPLNEPLLFVNDDVDIAVDTTMDFPVYGAPNDVLAFRSKVTQLLAEAGITPEQFIEGMDSETPETKPDTYYIAMNDRVQYTVSKDK